MMCEIINKLIEVNEVNKNIISINYANRYN